TAEPSALVGAEACPAPQDQRTGRCSAYTTKRQSHSPIPLVGSSHATPCRERRSVLPSNRAIAHSHVQALPGQAPPLKTRQLVHGGTVWQRTLTPRIQGGAPRPRGKSRDQTADRDQTQPLDRTEGIDLAGVSPDFPREGQCLRRQ